MTYSLGGGPVVMQSEPVNFDKPYVLERVLVHDFRYVMRVWNMLGQLPDGHKTPEIESALKESLRFAKQSVAAIDTKVGNPVRLLMDAVNAFKPVMSSLHDETQAYLRNQGYESLDKDIILAQGIPGSRVRPNLCIPEYEENGIDPDFPIGIPPDGLDLLIWAL